MTVSPFLANKQRNPLLSNYPIKLKAQSLVAAHPLANSQPLFGSSVNHNSNGDQFVFSGGKAKSGALPVSSKLLFKGILHDEDPDDIFYESDGGRKYDAGYDPKTGAPYYYKNKKTNIRTPLQSSAPPPAASPPPREAEVVYSDDEGVWLPYNGLHRLVRIDAQGPYFHKDKYDFDHDKRTSVQAAQDPYNVTGYFGKKKESSSKALVTTSSQPTKASGKKNSNLRDLHPRDLEDAIKDSNTFYYHGKHKGQPQLWFKWPGGGSYKVKSDKVQLWVETRRNELWNIKPVYDQNPPPATINVAGAESSTDNDSDFGDKAKEYIGGHVKGTREKIVGTAIGTVAGNQVGKVAENFIPTNTETYSSYRDIHYTPATALPPAPIPADWDERRYGPYEPEVQWDVPDQRTVTIAPMSVDAITGEETPAFTRPLVRAGNPPGIFTNWDSVSETEHALPSTHGDFEKPIDRRVRKHIVNRDGTTQDGAYNEKVGTKSVKRHTDYKQGAQKVERGFGGLVDGVENLFSDMFGSGSKKQSRRRRGEYDEDLVD